MKVRALKSFVGKITMNLDDVKEINDTEYAKSLIKAKFVEVLEDEKEEEVKEVKSTNEKPKKYKRK